jgi:phenylacetate-CoA ligase
MLLYYLIDVLRGTDVVKDFNNIKKEIAQGHDFLEAQKHQKLIELLKKLPSHPFYKESISGFDEATIHADPYRILQSLPYTTKQQISNYGKWFQENDPGQTYEDRFTGGSTGTPFKYQLSKHSISRITAFNYFLWHHFLGYNIGDKILSLGGDSLGKTPNFKTKMYNYLQRKYFIPGDIINKNVLDEGLKLLFDTKYDVIYAYTSSLGFFVDEAIRRNMSFKRKIKGVITVSEMLPDETLQKFKDYFKCEVLNCYGARDGGVMGGEMKSMGSGFHFNFYDCIVESVQLDEQLGKQELVLTNLGNTSFPFVRYRVGDIGTIEKYTNGNHLPLDKIINLEGRTRDLVYTPSRKVVHGSAFNAILKASSGIDRYQIVQDADYNLEVRIKSNQSEIAEDAIINLLKSIVNDPAVCIKIALNKEFIQGQNQKHKIIVSNIK